VQAIEIQHAGYLTLAASELVARPMPRLMVTIWGADISLFGRLPAHRPRIRALLSKADYYSCETARDVGLARAFGFAGQSWPAMPNAGGLDLTRVAPWRQVPVAARRTVLVKGYQGIMGRALVALAAIGRCADLLREYRIVIYSGQGPDVEMAADLLREDAGLNVRLLPKASHDDMLKWFGSARVYIGSSIADGASTSMLEAIAMGACPIQSDTAAAAEWIQPGRTGFIVPPDDPAAIAEALRQAIGDDAFVDAAAACNARVASARLDQRVIRSRVVALYAKTLSGDPLTDAASTEPAGDSVGGATAAGREADAPLPREPFRLDHVQRVAIFGSGAHQPAARRLAERCGWDVAYCVDNDPARQGSTSEGAFVAPPSHLHADPVDLVIVASDAHRQPLVDQLEEMGFAAGVRQIWFRSAVQVDDTCIQVR
jgi:hypothetical protein